MGHRTGIHPVLASLKSPCPQALLGNFPAMTPVDTAPHTCGVTSPSSAATLSLCVAPSWALLHRALLTVAESADKCQVSYLSPFLLAVPKGWQSPGQALHVPTAWD